MGERPKCRCGAYAKPELRRRGTNDVVCSRCYDQSWEGHGAEWEASFARELIDDHDLYAPVEDDRYGYADDY